MADTLGNARLNGGNQNNKRARTGFGQTLPLDIQSSNKAIVNYGNEYGKRDEDVHDIQEGD